MRGLPPVTIRTTERRFRSGPNLLSDLKVLAVDGLAPKWFSFSTTQDSMGNEWITVIYQRSGQLRDLDVRRPSLDLSFPNSVWERNSAKLCFASRHETEFGNKKETNASGSRCEIRWL